MFELLNRYFILSALEICKTVDTCTKLPVLFDTEKSGIRRSF